MGFIPLTVVTFDILSEDYSKVNPHGLYMLLCVFFCLSAVFVVRLCYVNKCKIYEDFWGQNTAVHPNVVINTSPNTALLLFLQACVFGAIILCIYAKPMIYFDDL